MRRARVGLVGLVVLGVALAGRAQQDKKGGKPKPWSPYAGTWKVTVLDNGEEASVWLVRLDPDAKKKAEVLWGITTRQDDFKTSEPELLRADATGLRLRLRTGERDYLVNALPPSKAV